MARLRGLGGRTAEGAVRSTRWIRVEDWVELYDVVPLPQLQLAQDGARDLRMQRQIQPRSLP